VLAAAVLLAALLVGGLAGVLADELLDDLEWPSALGGERDDDDLDDEEELLRGLELDAGQRRRIEAIVDAREERLERWWRSRLPELRTLVDGSRDEIRAVLSPEQRTEFDHRVAERGAPDLEDPTD
jgi:Spy/CpxP family protein refolding chaperone